MRLEQRGGGGKEELPRSYPGSEGTKYNEERHQIFEARIYSFYCPDGYPGRKNKVIQLTQILNLGDRMGRWTNDGRSGLERGN